MRPLIRARDARIPLGARPQVNLLPEDLRAARRLRRVRTVMAGAVVTSVFVAIGLSGGAYVLERQANAQLEAAQQRADALLSEQARFAGVTSVRQGLVSAAAAQRAASVRMIDWETYLDALSTSLPKGLTIGSIAVDSTLPAAAPGAAPAAGAATNVFSGTHVATITVHVLTTKLSTVQLWLASLPALKGFVDASPGAVNPATAGGLDVIVTIHLNSNAYTTPAAAVAATSTTTGSVSPSTAQATAGSNGAQQ